MQVGRLARVVSVLALAILGVAARAAAGAPEVEYFGRFDFSQAAGARFAWPGSAIKARFTGTAASVRLKNSGGDMNFSVVIDGGSPTVFKSKSGTTASYSLASGLPGGEHMVLVVRNNEAWNGPTQFLGFDFHGGYLMAPLPAASAHRLEVYGDSISTAYGNMRTSGCGAYSVDDQNVYFGYAAKTARIMGMPPPTIIAWSGKGIYHNGAGAPANVDTIAQTYDRAVGNETLVWDFPADKAPDIVLVALGSNDMNPLPSGMLPAPSDLTEAYVGFAKTLRVRYPMATLIFGVGPMGHSYRSSVLAAVSALNAGGDTKVSSIVFSQNRAPYGCETHPSETQHTVMANELVNALKKLGY